MRDESADYDLGGGYNADYVAPTGPDTMAGFTAIALVHVVGRDFPHERPQGTVIADFDATGPEPAQASDSTRSVSRVVRMSVDRQIKGDAGPCLTLDILGGTANRFHTDGHLGVIHVGDRLAVFLDVDRRPEFILPVVNGPIGIPFGGNRSVDVNTWTGSSASSQG
ncbi:MAG: hypothetical protein JWO37_407 [Acidimicrobiales bacterium]|nr:hypothetical protein [Acidimicrobiales bacterium]